MKLSEALVLKAEWWATPFPEEQEVEDVLEDAGMFIKTIHTLNEIYPEHSKNASNLHRATLCLLESELQKDESN